MAGDKREREERRLEKDDEKREKVREKKKQQISRAWASEVMCRDLVFIFPLNMKAAGPIKM